MIYMYYVAYLMFCFYYRFRDSVLLSKSLYQNEGKMLRLSNLTAHDSGTITCRANNPSHAIMSAPATLSVKGKTLKQTNVGTLDYCDVKVKCMQKPEIEAIRTQFKPSKAKREIT